MKYGLSDTQLDEIVALIGSYPEIEEAILFGSRAIGSYKEASDVDIALKGETVTAALAAKLKFDFEEDTYLPFFFDFVAYPTITSESLREHIEQKGVSIYRVGWRECKIGDLITLEYGKSLKDYYAFNGRYPVYGTNGKIGSTASYLSPIPSIVIGRKGAYRGVHFSNSPFYVIDTAFYVKPKSEDIDLRFLYNFFLNQNINAMDSGSAIPSTDRYEIYDIDISLPPLHEQKTIASVLSSLDDKIDLLNRQNKNLETMAETLFRQWFVEEAEADWAEGKIEDLFILQRGFDLPSQNRRDGLYPIFAASGFSGRHAEHKVKAPGVTTGRSGLLGKVFFIMEDFWPLNTSLFVKEYKIGTPLFSYFMLMTLDLESFNAGSAVPTLNRNHVHEYSILIPPRALIEKFEDLMIPNFKKIQFNNFQIHTLSNIRDTLLPKFMSGEVKVLI